MIFSSWRLLATLLMLAAFGLTATGASPGGDMLDAYHLLLNIFIYVAAAMAAFSVAWAGFTVMWDRENAASASRAKAAVIGALSGLMLTLLAKGIVVLLVDSTTVVLPTR